MGNNEFLQLCKKIVANYFNSNVDQTDKKKITENDIYILFGHAKRYRITKL